MPGQIDRRVEIVLSDGTPVDGTHPLPTSGGGGGGGGAVTVADGADSAEGFTTDPAVQGDNPGTVSAKLRGLNKSVAAGLPITAAVLPLPAGAATDTTVAGVTTAVNTLTTQSDFDAKVGSLTETAPATDIASSGLNGRLQRVAQRISSLIALLPTALVSNRLDVNLGAAPAAVTLGAGSATVGNVGVNKIPGTISTANSSTATLLANAVFTGAGEDISGFAAAVVSVFADQAGTLSPQFSSDGTHWDFVGSHAITASTGAMFVFRPGAEFFRIVYTNGGTNQGALRLQTVYHLDDVDVATAQALGAGLPNPTTIQVGADLMVQTGGTNPATWAPAKADSSNRPVVASDDGSLATLGTTTNAGIVTDVAGTAIGFLRGSIIQWAAFLSRFPAALGSTTAANSLPVTLPTDGQFVTSTGSLTETAPATDIASSGLNGRLQRIAQRLTSLIALLPTALVNNRLDVNVGKAPGTISSANSSTATLLANAVFTGTSEDVSSFALIEVSVFADQVSAAGGLSLQFSSDGTHWDLTQAVTISANAGAMFALCPCAEFFRLVYTNGATNQGAFRLQTLYRPVAAPQTQATFQDVNAALSPTNIMQRVAADLVIQNAAGNTSVRPRVASDNVAGVGGGSLMAAAGLVYDTGGSKFWPIQGTTGGQQFVQAQGIQASGAAVATNPILTGGIDGSLIRYFLTDTSGRQIAVGAAAAGSAIAGNPVAMGLSDITNAQYWRQVPDSANAAAVTGIAMAALMLRNAAGDMRPWGSAGLTVDNTTGANIAGAALWAANGTTNYDKVRNNTATVVQASTLTTVQTINTDIVNYNGRAFMAHANVTIYNGGSILMKLQWKDANGLFVDIPGATTGTVTSGADLLLNVGPTVWPANTATMFNLNFFVPRQIRLVTVIATASVTFSQSYDLPAN